MKTAFRWRTGRRNKCHILNNARLAQQRKDITLITNVTLDMAKQEGRKLGGTNAAMSWCEQYCRGLITE